MSEENKDSKTTAVKEGIETVTKGIKETASQFLELAKKTIKEVAPAVWKSVKMKIWGDAGGLILFVCLISSAVFYVGALKTLGVPVFLGFVVIISFILASAFKRLIASDYYALMEILKLANKKG